MLKGFRILTAIFICITDLLFFVSFVNAAGPLSSPNKELPLLIRLATGQFDPLNSRQLSALPQSLRLDKYPGDGTGYYLVQFKGPITEVNKQALAQAGAEIFDYVPDFAFIVKMNDATRLVLNNAADIRWIGLYQPGHRLAPDLWLAQQTGSTDILNLTVVGFKGEDVTRITTQIEDIGGTVMETAVTPWKNKSQVQISADHLNALSKIAEVKWVEPLPQWILANGKATKIMKARDVWDAHGLYGADQTIAVADTGLDQGSTAAANLHDDFEDGNGHTRVIQIFDLVGDGADDKNGHGTHVAGSALGNGSRSGATPNIHNYPAEAHAGLAPEANLIFQAIQNNSTGSLTGIPFDLNNLFSSADNAGATIHTNSWGDPLTLGRYTSSAQDVDEYIWDHRGFTILFAAGNQGVDGDGDGIIDPNSITSPGTAKNAITVGASENDRLVGGLNPGGSCATWHSCFSTPVDKYPMNPIRDDLLSNNPAGLAAFSGRGPTDDGRIKPDLVAPGTNIASTRSSQSTGKGWGEIDANYIYLGGTSMSTPLVAGAVALVRDFYQTIEAITPSAALIKATLIAGATDISPGQYGTGITQEIPAAPRPNNAAGWGRVNVKNSLFPATPNRLAYDDELTGLQTGQVAIYTYSITTTNQPMSVILAWSDYPGTPVANGGLVNDLDLSVTPTLSTSPIPTNDLGGSDHINNVEGVDLTSALTGTYTITVHGYNVPQGPQPYALVVSGPGMLSQPVITTTPVTTSTIYLPFISRSEAQAAIIPTLVNGDFEAGSNGVWQESSTRGFDLIVDSFSPNPLTPHSGIWGGWLGGASNETATLSQQVTIPAEATSFALTFWYWISSVDACGFDQAWVEVNNTKFKTFDLCTVNNTTAWVKEVVPMSSYAGQIITIEFHINTDNLNNSNFFLDDVAFEAITVTQQMPSPSPRIDNSTNALPRP